MVTVSVIMSVFNEPLEWVKISVESILSQTFTDFEFIVVDDNPQKEELKLFLTDLSKKDSRVRIVFNERNLGLAKSLNRALLLSKGKYVARMDADDESLPNRLFTQVNFLEENEIVDLCGSYAKRFGDIPFYSKRNFLVGKTNEEVLISSFFDSPVIHPSIMFRNDKNIFYDENVVRAQDYELWSRLLVRDYKIQNIPLFLINYRTTKKSKMLNYVSGQIATANYARSQLFNHFFYERNDMEIDLHNKICSKSLDQNCDIQQIEDWLMKFSILLKKKFPGNEIYIQKKISFYWEVSSLNCASFFRCISSPLCKSKKIIVLLRFLMKRVRNVNNSKTNSAV